MVETDWREILNFSQRELMQADKEKLCENLAWMEADDIELNFTDLKTLFRLAQDILKYKSEQVDTLRGQLQTTEKKSEKKKVNKFFVETPAKTADSVLETIVHQEEVIKTNKEIIEQLYADIAELEDTKKKLAENKDNADQESESSRDVLSEINTVTQLEYEITMKNKHIRKLLGDVKALEDDNGKLKEKVSVLKDKLTEATELIENLTEHMFKINNELIEVKDVLGKSEETKITLSIEIDTLRKKIFDMNSGKENLYDDIKSKVQHWKNIARSKKGEIESLSNENTRLKQELIQASKSFSSCDKNEKFDEEQKMKVLQEKLLEASNELIQSAKIIEILKSENKDLKATLEEFQDVSETGTKNESDDGKEQIIRLRKKVKTLSTSIADAEAMLSTRDKEVTELTTQLQTLQTDEGIKKIINNSKSMNDQHLIKNKKIQTLIQEVNTLNKLVDNLQLENETMRQKLNIPQDIDIPTRGILKKYRDLEHSYIDLKKENRKIDNKLITAELNNRRLKSTISKMSTLLHEIGYTEDRVKEIRESCEQDDMPTDGGGESSVILSKRSKESHEEVSDNKIQEIRTIIEENEGLRKGLQEILEFLKDNSTTSSGVLALQCPSLEAVLHSMEARHAAGWFAPHMTTTMELKAAIGGKDALLTALHDARKETIKVMNQLSEESQKSKALERKLHDIEAQNKAHKEKDTNISHSSDIEIDEFGDWIFENETNKINFYEKDEIEKFILKGKTVYSEKIKNILVYFLNKFQMLFNNITTLTIQSTDNQNNWSIQEEQYKAQIENLKAQLNDDDDDSENSPGVINIINSTYLQRKCTYLEESYKYIRTLNENLKREYFECKRDAMTAASKYETQIQKLLISSISLTEKLQNSISTRLFWKQNQALNEITTKYRNLLNEKVKNTSTELDLEKRLVNDKIEIINAVQNQLLQLKDKDGNDNPNTLINIEQTVLQKQLSEICIELTNKNNEIKKLENINITLQQSQNDLIDKSLSQKTNEDIDYMNERINELVKENKSLKEQCSHVSNQLDIALLQLQDSQQIQLNNDMEVNMLRHQILDLQSVSDNKAIIARLSSEILVAHLQTIESHKKIERLNNSLNKENHLRIEAEEMLQMRQKIFDLYALRYETKFKYIIKIMQALRNQYEGNIPLMSIENYLNNIEDIFNKTQVINEKLNEVEDLRSSLISKHAVFNQILDLSKNNCLEDEDKCPHNLQYIVMQNSHARDLDLFNKKLSVLEQCKDEMKRQCKNLEKKLVLVSQVFDKSITNDYIGIKNPHEDDTKINMLKVEDVQSEDESSSRKSRTITLPKPQILKQSKNNDNNLINSPTFRAGSNNKYVNVSVQTSTIEKTTVKNKVVQTDEDHELHKLIITVDELQSTKNDISKELAEVVELAQRRHEEIDILNNKILELDTTIKHYENSIHYKDEANKKLCSNIEDLKQELSETLKRYTTERNKVKEITNDDNKILLTALKKLENDKNTIVEEYKELLNNERVEYSKSIKDLNLKIMDLQTQLDNTSVKVNQVDESSKTDIIKETSQKYNLKILELEDKCFKMENEMEGYRTELKNNQCELKRWKDLASERLSKMEHLNLQVQEKYNHEVESYKAENQHWIAQLGETQREHMDLRTRMTEQRALLMKQLADKDVHIDQLRSAVHNLKNQLMSMQNIISVNDPSFDLSAIVEVDEMSDVMSQHGSDKLELKFESTVDLHDVQDNVVRMPSTSTAIWQEPVIERLRREKQLAFKQNSLLRRQIKALAGRERRARLDAQNLKNQVFRISTSGTKSVTAETAALHNKIATLQAQLMSARRETTSSVTLWDKWKRAQQSSERWHARYEEKCQEVMKLESNLNLAKSSIARLEKEKRILLARLSEIRADLSKQSPVEKHDDELSEKYEQSVGDHVTSQALLDRVQAQQRRIVALELAERGNEVLISEYEKSLAEITSLKGQVLKLESALLESQIRTPMNNARDPQPELEYWKSYCEMLKEENVQLTLKVNSIETAPTTAHQQRINDLEQTVLTLRGLVSKLQSEQKTSGILKRVDSRPSSGRSVVDKGRSQAESYRTEIANLKRSIHDKDLLLERSKDMLKIAADREDELLRENAVLRRRLRELTKPKEGFLSA